MARLTLEEKIQKNQTAIVNEKRNLANAKQRLKRLEQTKKDLLQKQKEKQIENMVEKLVLNGINNSEQVENMIAFCKNNGSNHLFQTNHKSNTEHDDNKSTE